MLELGCEGKREIYPLNREKMSMMGMGRRTCKGKKHARFSQQLGSLLLASVRSLFLPVS